MPLLRNLILRKEVPNFVHLDTTPAVAHYRQLHMRQPRTIWRKDGSGRTPGRRNRKVYDPNVLCDQDGVLFLLKEEPGDDEGAIEQDGAVGEAEVQPPTPIAAQINHFQKGVLLLQHEATSHGQFKFGSSSNSSSSSTAAAVSAAVQQQQQQ